MLLVDLYWDATPVIPNRNGASLWVNVNFDQVHSFVPLEVVSGIDQYFV